MEIDRFSKIRAQPCLFLIFHNFHSMSLLWTSVVWVPYRENHCFFQLFLEENVKK